MKYIDAFIYSNRTGIRILRHLLFWLTDITNYLLIVSVDTPIDATEVYRVIFKIPLIALAAYFVLYYLIPMFSNPKERGKLFLWIFIVLLYLGVGLRYYKYYILEPILDPNQVVNFNIWDFRRILSDILSAMTVISTAIGIKVIKSKTELQQKNKELSEEKRISELKFLKAQMHPHFLFNTLNTLYSDAIKDNGKSEEIVLRLSNLMRFILEECNKPVISLQKEIKVIEDYIALEKLRHGSRLQINSTINLKNPNVFISPLLLLPFVENSCKHTLLSKRGVIHIDMKISTEGNSILFYVENEIAQPVYLNGAAHGTGIQNVRKQLELLYNQNFTLDVKKDTEKYVVQLQVPSLAENAQN